MARHVRNVNLVIETISESIPTQSTLYHLIVSLMTVMKPSNIPVSKFRRKPKQPINKLYYDVLEKWDDGLAKFHFILKACDCPNSVIEPLNEFVSKPFDTTDIKVKFQLMLNAVCTGLEPEKAEKLLHIARVELSPPVHIENLDPPTSDGDFTPRLLHFFSEVQQRLQLAPDNLDNLTRWLSSIHCLDIQEVVIKFEEEHNKKRSATNSESNSLPSYQSEGTEFKPGVQNHHQDSIEEENEPGVEKSKLVTR